MSQTDRDARARAREPVAARAVAPRLILCAGLALALSACSDFVPRWDLTRDRVIAVRATPPAVLADGVSELDALITASGDVQLASPVLVRALEGVVAVAVEQRGETWTVRAPSEATLAEARARLGLAAGALLEAEVELELDVGGARKLATKRIGLGETRANPRLTVRLDGAAVPASGPAALPLARAVSLEAEATEQDAVDWLTSIGELSDDDDAVGSIEVTEPGAGVLVGVRRDGVGGVGWAIVPVEAR
jgi:hypothetical protein